MSHRQKRSLTEMIGALFTLGPELIASLIMDGKLSAKWVAVIFWGLIVLAGIAAWTVIYGTNGG